MRTLAYGAALLMIVGVLACGDAPGDDGAAMDDPMPTWVDDVAQVANAIQARPAAADSILSANDMTRAQLDSLLYEIAEDPALTEAYQQARGR